MPLLCFGCRTPSMLGGCAVQPAPTVRACSWNGSCSAMAIPDASWLAWQAKGCLGVQETQDVSKPPLQQREFGSIPCLPGCVWVKEHLEWGQSEADSRYWGYWLLWDRAGVGGKSRWGLSCKKIASSFLWGSGPCDFKRESAQLCREIGSSSVLLMAHL